MPGHSIQRLLFKEAGGKKVGADFEGGEVTSDAGLLLLREVDRKLRLTERVAACCGRQGKGDRFCL